MRFSSIALAAVAAGTAFAGNHNHARLHKTHKPRASTPAEVEKRGLILDAIHEAEIITLGLISAGINSLDGTDADVWVGDNGQYTNDFINQGDDDVVVVIWGPAASWVNVDAPLVTATVKAGSNTTVSFKDGASGAWAVIYKDTELVNGQISETWGEYTFGEWGVVDVSREVNMNGHSMAIHGPKCISDMDTCVFKCKGDAANCWQEYELVNCENGSQEGATNGLSYGAPSGGCGGMGSSAALKTYIN
ncbi:uncharacterized protein K452DRAFT_327152 [Aplosporella prunicola CBS 121167]|uniref:Effector 5 n=1 Tax=Aplosporella prunicola CBS 121167 TaxID=1176127 RepID=A0A6A6BG72_9PEZI|nr:uncharacterized protein K452DRAFT_327152 [Aplosporella prunicola CBS 121167]KAF2141511.1 hypothetical protein K452DRAFT_327152 [Aplosporella prunicola CBS 121167]